MIILFLGKIKETVFFLDTISVEWQEFIGNLANTSTGSKPAPPSHHPYVYMLTPGDIQIYGLELDAVSEEVDASE